MAASVFLSHPASLEHDTGPHPERAQRIVAIQRELEGHDWLGYRRAEAPAASRGDVTAVHPAGYVDEIEAFCARGGGMLDADTVASTGSWEAALRGAGAAVELADLLLAGDVRTGFSATRPPGHHAEVARAMGFCLFNNVAIAARHALDGGKVERVLILDWDVHHGNGTNDIFHADDDVLFVSIHQWPLYPGSGAASDVGSGAGKGYTVNLPVPGGSGDASFASLVEHVVVPLARAYEPGLILISAGFDAHADDPLAGCAVTEQGFRAMARSMRIVADELGVPLGAVLEGGYELSALARSVVVVMDELAAAPGRPAPSVERHELADAATERLSSHWPQLASLAG